MTTITITLKEKLMLSYYKLKQKIFMKTLFRDKHLFDFSNYSIDSKFYIVFNDKVISKMKDEFEGKIIIEFFGLKSKMLNSIDVDGTENKKGKGVNSVVVKIIRYKEYLDVLIIKK